MKNVKFYLSECYSTCFLKSGARQKSQGWTFGWMGFFCRVSLTDQKHFVVAAKSFALMWDLLMDVDTV